MSQRKWKEQKLKRIFTIKNGGTPKSNESTYWTPEEVIWITPEDLSKGNSYINNSIRKISYEGLENSSANIVKAGSIVLSTRAPIGNIKIVETPYATNQGCKSLESNDNIDIRFFYYYLSINSEYLNHLGRGTTFLELSNEGLKNIELLVPKLSEQKNISNYLDDKITEIDNLISDKERLIELLEEKRQSVITETVTKGLDPNVEMKDSGIEWIGKIPEHWRLESIKYHSALNKKVLSESMHPDTEIHYIDIGSVNSKGEISNTEKMKFKNAPSRARRILSKNDTIISTVRTYLRAITTIEEVKENETLIGSTGFAVLSPNKTVNKDYFSYIFQTTSYIDGIVSMSKGVSYPAINAVDIVNMKMILPPIEEQSLIVAKIRKELKELNDLELDLIIQKEKLKEYRESLIYEAVTGKIDVRDYAVEQEEVY